MKVVTIYSGGMDSATLLRHALADPRVGWVYALSFDYGQKHVKELEYARAYVNELRMDASLPQITHKVVDLRSVSSLLSSSLMSSGGAVPEGHYEDSTMQQTVVPNRNMFMLSLAAAYAISVEAEVVYYGAHTGDHAIYPDCRPEFISAMNLAVDEGNYKAPRIVAPFINLTKGGILKVGLGLGVNYARTWTCYAGEAISCGRCGSCQERLEAFAQQGLPDPLEYVSRTLLEKGA